MLPRPLPRLVPFFALLVACDGSFLHSVPDVGAPNDNRCTAVAAPDDVIVSAAVDGVTITWSGAVTGDYTFIVQKREPGGTWGETGRVASSASTFLDASCTQPNSACEYRVVAASAACQTAPSPAVFAYTLPVAIADFVATGNGDAVDLSWGQNNLYSDGFVVERSDDGGDYAEITTLSGDLGAHADPVARNVAYCYRLSAITDAGRGPAVESCTQSGATAVTLDLGRFVDRIEVSWSGINRFETGYVVRRDGEVIGTVPTDTLQLDDTDVTAGSHDYSVVALSRTGDSSAATGAAELLRTDVVTAQSPRVVGCSLTASATVGSQVGASLESVDAALESTLDETVSVDLGVYSVTGTISLRGLGMFEALWGPTYAHGASFEVVFNHRLVMAAADQLVATTSFAAGSRTGEGLQPWHIDVPLDATACGADGLGRLASIDAANDHTCMVSNAERVLCWGKGTDGQLGTAVGATNSAYPHVVCAANEGPGCGGAFLLRGDNVRIATGHSMSFAIAENGIVRMWGRQPAPGATLPLPTVHPNLDGTAGMKIITVAAGDEFGCGLTDSNRVVCWGFNDGGQMGTGQALNTNDNPANPVRTSSSALLMDARSVGVGGVHACAITTGGVYCWGENGKGQVGNNSVTTPVLYATAVSSSPANPKQLALGKEFTCGLFADQVACWGTRVNGVIGDGGETTGTQLVPSPRVQGSGGALSNVVAIAAGEAHACALLSNSRVACWGANGQGQLGANSGANSNLAVDVVAVGGIGTLSNAVAITAGRAHTCAVLADASVACWGANDVGQLGDGTLTSRETPALVRCDGTDLGCGPAGSPTYRAALRGKGTLGVIQ